MIKCNDYIRKSKPYLLLIYVCLFLVNEFYPLTIWNNLRIPVLIILLVSAFPRITRFNKYLSLILFIIGGLLYANAGVKSSELILGLYYNAGIICLLISVPMLGVILYFDDLKKTINNIIKRRIHTEFGFYCFTIMTINILGMLLGIASIPFVYQLLEKSSKRFSNNVFHKALYRGFCTNLIWAPNTVSVAVVLNYMQISWQIIAPSAIIIAISANIMSFVIGRITCSRVKEENNNEIPIKNGGEYKTIIRVVIYLIFVVSVIIILQYFIDKSVLVIVPITAFVAPAFLAVICKKTLILRKKFMEYLGVTLQNMNNEILLFTSIGFFGNALRLSKIKDIIPLFIENIGIDTPYLLIPLIALIIGLLSIIGVHPIITISTLAVTLPINTLPISEVQLAMSLLTGYFMYNTIAPFSTVVLVFSGVIKEKPIDIVRLNFGYAILFTVLVTVVLTLV